MATDKLLEGPAEFILTGILASILVVQILIEEIQEYKVVTTASLVKVLNPLFRRKSLQAVTDSPYAVYFLDKYLGSKLLGNEVFIVLRYSAETDILL